jgi:UDP-N-acetyl-D-mannosaminuronic acid dehydrogenase
MNVTIIGGCGRAGLPLAMSLADVGIHVCAFDINAAAVQAVRERCMPFREHGDPQGMLDRVVSTGRLSASTDPASVAAADVIIVVIGTPVDEHLNPDPNAVLRALEQTVPFMRSGQLLMLRSTVYPGVTARVERSLARRGLDIDVVFCPERIAEGHALTELRTLPQLVGARNDAGLERATAVFDALGVSTVPLTPEEAELAKLFTNTWRYLKFAAANQFWLMANEAGLDFARIRDAIAFEYPRAADLPGPGFAAGPCLFKDTMQLAAFTNNTFVLGHAAMLVNEGMPLNIVEFIERTTNLADTSVGILGMAFKAGSDDTRESLSYKLRRILRFRAREVLCTDPYVTSDPTLLPLEEVLQRVDLLIVGAPHGTYRDLRSTTTLPIVDVWNLTGQGSLV